MTGFSVDPDYICANPCIKKQQKKSTFHANAGTHALVPLQDIPFIRAKIWEAENISPNDTRKTETAILITTLCLFWQHDTPDTPLAAANLIKVIRKNSVVNQAQQNDKREIISWRKPRDSGPIKVTLQLMRLTGTPANMLLDLKMQYHIFKIA